MRNYNTATESQTATESEYQLGSKFEFDSESTPDSGTEVVDGSSSDSGSVNSSSGFTPAEDLPGAADVLSSLPESVNDQPRSFDEATLNTFEVPSTFDVDEAPLRFGDEPFDESSPAAASPDTPTPFSDFVNYFDVAATPNPDLSQIPEVVIDPVTDELSVSPDEDPTVVVLWNQAIREAVIDSGPGPTVASRAYGILNSAIYNAWAAYEGTPIATVNGDALQRPESENTENNKTEALSYAAFQTAINLFPEQSAIFVDLMNQLGFDPSIVSFNPTTPAGVGNISAQALIGVTTQDGSNQLGDDPNGDGTPFSDTTGYQSVNTPEELSFVDRLQLENVPVNSTAFLDDTPAPTNDLTGPSGDVGFVTTPDTPADTVVIDGVENVTAQFLTPQWGGVDGFALESGDQFRPGPPIPFFEEGVEGTVNFDTRTITLGDGTKVDITQDIIGTIVNDQFIAQAQRIVEVSANLTDEQKTVAEYFEDGLGSSFPPGNSLVEGEIVSDRDNNTLNEDVQLFFALGNSQFDAGIASWDAKTFYDYARPVTAIRGLGELGLIGEFDSELGGFAIDAYAGPGFGTQRILATDFISYQQPGADLSPPFAEYVSGHSTFSAATGIVLEEFTGNDDFGLSIEFAPGTSRFEPGITPAEGEPVTLNFDTFEEYADGSGISRIYGGIHFEEGDFEGRALGRQVGTAVVNAARTYLNGEDPTQDFSDESFAPEPSPEDLAAI